MSKHYNIPRQMLIAVLVGVVFSLSQPHTALATPGKTKPPQKTNSVTKQKTFKSPSEESTAQRDKRMYRECKGMPNAGACLGYTRR